MKHVHWLKPKERNLLSFGWGRFLLSALMTASTNILNPNDMNNLLVSLGATPQNDGWLLIGTIIYYPLTILFFHWTCPYLLIISPRHLIDWLKGACNRNCIISCIHQLSKITLHIFLPNITMYISLICVYMLSLLSCTICSIITFYFNYWVATNELKKRSF